MKLVKAKNLAERSGQPWLKKLQKFLNGKIVLWKHFKDIAFKYKLSSSFIIMKSFLTPGIYWFILESGKINVVFIWFNVERSPWNTPWKARQIITQMDEFEMTRKHGTSITTTNLNFLGILFLPGWRTKAYKCSLALRHVPGLYSPAGNILLWQAGWHR